MAIRTIHIGSDGSRDYTTWNAFISDLGAGLPASVDADPTYTDWDVLLYQDGVSPASMAITASTLPVATPPRSIRVRAAPGLGAGGLNNNHTENRTATTPLDIDSALGVHMTFATGFSNGITGRAGASIEDLQFTATGHSGASVFLQNGGSLKRCIFEATHSQARAVIYAQATGEELEITDCVGITNSTASNKGVYIQLFGTAVLTYSGNTAICINPANTINQVKITGSNQNVQMHGNVSVGFPTAYDVSTLTNLTASYNASDDTSAPGTSPVHSISAASAFEGVTASAVTDARAAAAGALDGAWGATINATDIAGTTRGAPATIGAWEIVSGAVDVDLDIPAVDISIAALAPTITIDLDVVLNIPAANVTIAALAPTLSIDVVLNIPAVDISIAALAPTLAIDVALSIPAADIGITALAPTITIDLDVVLNIPAANVAVAALAPTLAIDVALNVPAANVTITALAPTLAVDVVLSIPATDISIAALAPTLTVGVVVVAPATNATSIEISVGIAQASAELGNGSPLIGTLTRKPNLPSLPWEAVAGTDQTWPLNILMFDPVAHWEGGQLVRETERMILAEAIVVTPLVGDFLTILATEYRVTEVEVLAPGGVPLYFELKVQD